MVKTTGFYLYLPAADAPPALAQVGGKALGLLRLERLGCEVPPWFALTTEACRASREGCGPIPDHPAPAVMEQVETALQRLGLTDGYLAVRSSATAEDGGERSFAGQFASMLFVKPAEIAAAIARVWASADSAHCREYARRNGVSLADLIPAVVVQRMVAPDIAGVMFTADPVSGARDRTVIAATYGLGEGIVNGSCNGDTYTVDKAGAVVKREIARKERCVKYDAEIGEVRLVPVPEPLRDSQACPDATLRRLAALGRSIAEALGQPQDIRISLIIVLQLRSADLPGDLPDRPRKPKQQGDRQLAEDIRVAGCQFDLEGNNITFQEQDHRVVGDQRVDQTGTHLGPEEELENQEHHDLRTQRLQSPPGQARKRHRLVEAGAQVIHHYETFQVLQTLLAPGMDREVVPDFYSFLVHTGSTHTGFECDIWAWRDRKFHNNYPPHGWCAARFTERFRNMLVREDMANPVLHLASALSPAWLNAGQRVRVANTPTDFGTLSFATAHRPQPSPHRALTSATCGTCAARHLPGHALIGGPAYGRLHSSTWRFAGMDTGCMS